jgi:RNA polymerase sigma-70 factor (ECF subfamily)
MHLAQTGAPGAGVVGLDDEAVAIRAREDREAFAELYVRHRDAVFRYLRARSDADDDALELTAVTFERALVSIDGYRTRGAGFRAWLFRIARNAAVDEARRRGRLRERWPRSAAAGDPGGPEVGPIDPGPGPDEAAIRAEEHYRLRVAMAGLAEPQRDALGLRFGAGLTAREIGEVIDKREAAVQKLIERAIDRLREVMA